MLALLYKKAIFNIEPLPILLTMYQLTNYNNYLHPLSIKYIL